MSNFTVNSTRFNKAMSALTRMTHTEAMKVIEKEAERAMDGAAKRTVRAKKSNLKKSKKAWIEGFRRRSKDGYITVNSGTKGGVKGMVWLISKRKDGGISKLSPSFVTNPKTAQWIADNIATAEDIKINEKLQKQLDKIGLAKQSFGIAQKRLGGTPNAVDMAARALTANGGQYVPYGNITVDRLPEKKSIIIVNSSPSASNRNAKGGVAMQKALNARASYFFVNAKKGVFRDMQATAGRYPGVIFKA